MNLQRETEMLTLGNGDAVHVETLPDRPAGNSDDYYSRFQAASAVSSF